MGTIDLATDISVPNSSLAGPLLKSPLVGVIRLQRAVTSSPSLFSRSTPKGWKEILSRWLLFSRKGPTWKSKHSPTPTSRNACSPD
ncbi:uncharacterized protein BCR38DRAFT_423957 [Pseudomassariella vexata]|uniref:Uncharacterized protein n=1 Tax=Pseudomassariella vexata TaxID=1141098 RepID=A0A1Y2EAQ5_9PEZI|nr:uncharacterized protein BCR38DRAFT_423957 [Pseudomassariella vexata]ORY68653.1 hypothetical protein BCR38DRAFT_423957 [Pseudomassariella vexata]